MRGVTGVSAPINRRWGIQISGCPPDDLVAPGGAVAHHMPAFDRNFRDEDNENEGDIDCDAQRNQRDDAECKPSPGIGLNSGLARIAGHVQNSCAITHEQLATAGSKLIIAHTLLRLQLPDALAILVAIVLVNRSIAAVEAAAPI